MVAVVHMTSGWDWFFFALVIVGVFLIGTAIGGRGR